MNHIKKFQADNGLVADGIIGKRTIHAMRCKFGIDTDAQMSHFLSQVAHETGNFEADTENLNYSASALLIVFPKYFQTIQSAKEYERKPEKIANYVYGNRMGNGSPQTGDGWKYRGRGALQLTGKDNYRLFSEYVNDKEVLTNPDIVATEYFWESALFYFTRNKLWDKMKGNDTEAVRVVRKAVNGGYNGLSEVQELFVKYYNLITR